MNKRWRYIKSNLSLYLMLVPGLFFLIIYKFVPLYGLQIAFKDFNIFLGENPFQAMEQSPWVGFKWFQELLTEPEFFQVFKNTLIINGYKILFLFPLPVLVAVFLNEIRSRAFKKLNQTLIYIPYFFSWVVVFGIFYSFFGSKGMVNQLIGFFGGEKVGFFTDPKIFRSLLVITEGWKEVGWNAVIYLAAITAIDTTQYEAASVDGANKLQRIWYITLPGLLPTIVLMLIIKVGYILDTGFEQILIMYNPTVYNVADVLQTFVYRIGLGQMNFSLGTAMGLFNSIVAFTLIIGCNQISRRILNRSIW